jgi:hypothetical protein
MKAGQLKIKLIAGVVAAALSSGANALVVDLFSTSQTDPTQTGGFFTDATANAADTGKTITSGVGSSIGAGDPTILGGNRDLYASLISTIGGGTSRVKVDGGILSFANDPNTRGRAQIQWDGNENTTAIDTTGLRFGGPTGVKFGSGTFKVDVIFSDLGFNFEITIYTDATHWTTVALISNAHATPTTTFIPLSAFNNPGLCGFSDPTIGVLSITCAAGNLVADLNNVGALVVDLNRLDAGVASLAVDLQLDAINVVPEPGSVALLGVGLLGLFGVGRRFKKLA